MLFLRSIVSDSISDCILVAFQPPLTWLTFFQRDAAKTRDLSAPGPVVSCERRGGRRVSSPRVEISDPTHHYTGRWTSEEGREECGCVVRALGVVGVVVARTLRVAGRSGQLLIFLFVWWSAAPYCRLPFCSSLIKMSAKVETKSTKKVVVAPKKQAPVRSANRATESDGGGGGGRMLHARGAGTRRSSAAMRAHLRVHRMRAAGRRCTAAVDGGATDGRGAVAIDW